MLYVEPMLGGVTFTCVAWHARGVRGAVEGAPLATARRSDTLRAVTHAHRRRAEGVERATRAVVGGGEEVAALDGARLGEDVHWQVVRLNLGRRFLQAVTKGGERGR